MCAVGSECTSRCDFCKQALSDKKPLHISNETAPHKVPSFKKKKKNSKDTAISMIKHNVKKYIKLHLYSELGHLILILALLFFFFFPSYFLL